MTGDDLDRYQVLRPRPDMERLHDLDRQVEELIAAGRWGYPAFLEILNQAREAANGFGDALGFLFRAAEPEWRRKHWLSDGLDP